MSTMANARNLTMITAMSPIVTKVHGNEGNIPCP